MAGPTHRHVVPHVESRIGAGPQRVGPCDDAPRGDGVEGSLIGRAKRAFQDRWTGYFGIPNVVLTDGGADFKNDVERGMELMGTMHMVTNADSPWSM